MNTLMWKSLLAAASLAATSLTAPAGPLKRADVPASPHWLIHVDFDGLRPTPIGQFLLGEMQKPENQSKIAAFQAVFNVDLRTQLHDVTLFSTGPRAEDGVLILYADFDPERLVTLAKAANDSQNAQYKSHTIYNWIDDKKKPKDGVRPRVYAVIHGKRVVLSQHAAGVRTALDVLDGSAPNLNSTKAFAPLGMPEDASFLEGAAAKIDLPGADPNAAIFRLSRLIRLQLGGDSQRLNATLTLEANDSDTASQLAAVAHGLVALVKLQQEKPEVVKLASALNLRQDDASVVATVSLPANDVLDFLKADAARKEKQAHKPKHEKAEEDEK